jgi:amidase
MDPFASATEPRAALRAGRTTAVELADLYIRRIEAHDGRLNAVVVRDFERARGMGGFRAPDGYGPADPRR